MNVIKSTIFVWLLMYLLFPLASLAMLESEEKESKSGLSAYFPQQISIDDSEEKIREMDMLSPSSSSSSSSSSPFSLPSSSSSPSISSSSSSSTSSRSTSTLYSPSPVAYGEGPNFYMPFKLGFEFQESHHLCPWAKSRQSIQKKPLFLMGDMASNRPLWNIVIDGQDIEFVLEPFSDTEYNLLEKSIKSLLVACKPLTQKGFDEDDLQQALHTPKIFNLIGTRDFEIKVGAGLRLSNMFPNCFEIWKKWLTSHSKYTARNDQELEILWKQEVELPTQPSQIFRIAGIPPKEVITFKDWFREIQQLINEQGLWVQENEFHFRSVENEPIKKLPELKFQPQATVQYPLEYSIPLFFSLFGFEKKSTVTSKLVEALPLLDDLSEINIETYFTKYHGLAFLHALTLSGISSKNNDVDLLHEIQQRYDHTEQVDAKSTLSFMSRRPFSNMWRDFRNETDDFWTLYSSSMGKNKVFADKFFKLSESRTVEWAEGIHPNYAEEIEEETRDLSPLMDYFTESFLAACNTGINPLPKLLSNGILSTTMIRNFDPTKVNVLSLGEKQTPRRIFESYYSQSIRSVQRPTSRYVFDLNNMRILEEEYSFDTLSPPLFLSDDDAMGFFKQPADELDVKVYGEAIVEIRNIKNAFFNPGFFLTIGNESLLGDSYMLFSFLKEIHREKVLSKEYTRGILNCTLKLEEK